MARVILPGFDGRSVGVTFRNGIAEDVPEGPALDYFRRSRHYLVADGEVLPADPDQPDGDLPAGNTRADGIEDEGDEPEPSDPTPPAVPKRPRR